jgi:uncharacterized protein YndB with AHSA1/START domain
MTHDAQTRTINITRVFDAPREKVWAAFTEPEQIMKWWGPEQFTSPAAEVDFRVGGKFLFCMHGPAGTPFDQDMWSGGIYKEIVPMEKIVATDHFADAEGNFISPKEAGMPGEWPTDEMLVTFTFEDAPGGKTKFTLKHEGHPESMAKDATSGWNTSLDKLAAAL